MQKNTKSNLPIKSSGAAWNHNAVRTRAPKVKTSVKAGGGSYNHNTTRAPKVKTSVKAGGGTYNHNPTRVRA